MPDQFTGNLSLVKPEIGASRDSWGAKTNQNWDTLDQLVFISTPIGAILDFAGGHAPSGWLVADGRPISRTTYAQLFAAIGTTFGVGDGTTTFNLPNLAGRSGVGPGTVTDANGNTATLALAQSIGNLGYQIQQTHLPNYPIYTDAQGWHSHGGATVNAGGHSHVTDGQGSHSHGGQTTVELQPHNHSGSTDTQGDHSHSLFEAFGSSGGGGGGGFTVSGASYFGGYTSTNGAHYHNLSIGNENQNHTHTINADGYHAHNVTYVGDHAHAIYGDGQHSHTIYLGGSGTWFPVVNPILVVTKIIFAGTQAAVRVMSMAADDSMPMTIEGESEELLDIREELRQLRALLTTMRGPAQQRRIAAPLRGPH